MKNIIYETKGRAREYCRWALNHYAGCTHGCLYCYAPKVTFRTPAEFNAAASPRVSTTEVSASAASFKGKRGPVLLSFLSDPYQPAERELQLTREVIGILHDSDIIVTVLTKAGGLVQRDFELYRPGDSFGTTLTFLDRKKSRLWEPGAALPAERIENLIAAKKAGILTWASLEPVIDPAETIQLIHTAARWVDHFKVGKLNYDRLAEKIDWRTFALQSIKAIQFHKKGFYIKNDLSKYVGQPGGLKEGLQIP